MLFNHFYLTQGQKLETWFVWPAIREYLGVQSRAFLIHKLTKQLFTGTMNCPIYFRRCSYKNSCLIELVYSSVLMTGNFKNILKFLILKIKVIYDII